MTYSVEYIRWAKAVWARVGKLANLDEVDHTQYDLHPAYQRGESVHEVAAQVLDKLIDQHNGPMGQPSFICVLPAPHCRESTACAAAGRCLAEPKGPYPWCRKPEECSKLGYCPRDPNCGE